MHSQSKWWEKALGREIEVMSSWADETDNEGLQKALQRNVHLMQLLQTNSYVILEAERVKRELVRLQKENDELQRKYGLLQEETKELKERIGVLLKENKKLLDKNYRISKENETMNKRYTWQSDELEHVKEKLKESKEDYNLIAYQL
jgi:predicted nuclease with TOPRIM domain